MTTLTPYGIDLGDEGIWDLLKLSGRIESQKLHEKE